MSKLSLSDLRKLLSGLQEEIGVSDNSMKALMDKYDISDRISGRNRSISYPHSAHVKPETFFMLPANSAQQYVYTTYGSIMHKYMNTIFMTGIGDFQEDEETRIKREQEQAKQIAQFESLIDNTAVSSPEVLKDPNPKPPVQQSPDYVHTLTGWRGWSVNNGKLKSLGQSSYWEPRKGTEARCISNDHPAPLMDCSCGYWSFKSSDLMKKALHAYRSSVMVVGSVEIWGKVIECENGFRSEFAYPKELWLLKPGLESLSWTYGVPVKRANS